MRVQAENELGRYCLPGKALHRPACKAILRGEVWERETVEFLCDRATGDIVHAGTFFGDFLPALSRHYGLVLAFEPNLDSYLCAEQTVRMNFDPAKDVNIALINAGLGATPGTASLKTRNKWGKYLGGASRVINRPGKIKIVTIDDMVAKYNANVGVIHLDVEGYEHAALAGARQTIEKFKPLLVLETMPLIVNDLGYKLVDRINGNYVLEPA